MTSVQLLDMEAVVEYDEFKIYSDQALLDLEDELYDDEVDGMHNWYFRDKVINEINRRGLWNNDI